MSQSLYRKYRPQTFADVVGQQHIVSTFSNAIVNDRIGHAYLFCGPRGTGKTTMARLLAKALMCDSGPAAQPDGTCEQCQAIAQGTHPDVYELDAASRTGVDNVRDEIINKVSFAPTQGRYKIYIIDEVHMLTTAAFNALLKTLEEPPQHVVFVMCTTDPHKVPDTILSRCQRFDFKHFTLDDLENRLAFVCKQEGFDFDQEALALIARHAQGGMRDALSTLEQLSVFGDGTIRVKEARSVLGEVEESSLEEFSLLIAAQDMSGCFSWLEAYTEQGRDLARFVQDLTAYTRDLYVARLLGEKTPVSPRTSAQKEDLVRVAQCFESADHLSRVLILLGDLAHKLRTATDQRLHVELACARMARPAADATVEALAQRIAHLEVQIEKLQVSGVQAGSQPQNPGFAKPVDSAQHVGSEQPVKYAEPADYAGSVGYVEPADYIGSAAPADSAVPADSAEPADSAQPAQPTMSRSAVLEAASLPNSATCIHDAYSQPTNPPAVSCKSAGVTPPTSAAVQDLSLYDASTLQRNWDAARMAVSERKTARGVLLMNTHVSVDELGRLIIELPEGSDFALTMLNKPENKELVGECLKQVFGGNVSFAFCTGYKCAPSQQPCQSNPTQSMPVDQPTMPTMPSFDPAYTQVSSFAKGVEAPLSTTSGSGVSSSEHAHEEVAVSSNSTEESVGVAPNQAGKNVGVAPNQAGKNVGVAPNQAKESTGVAVDQASGSVDPASITDLSSVEADTSRSNKEIPSELASMLTEGFGDGWIVKESSRGVSE